MKKKTGGGKVVIAGLVTVAVLGGIVFAATQDWKTGRNSLVDYTRAEMGDPRLQYEEGLKAQVTPALPSGRTSAQTWLEKSASAGYVPAMLALGDMYNAAPDEASGDMAVKWYQKASDAGSIEATTKLGSAYDIGRGTLKPDRTKSRVLFEKAAKAGDPRGEMFFGAILLQERKYKEGETWLLKASKDGDAEANAVLGNLYYDNSSPLRDWNKAATYYRKACDAGISGVMFNYAFMLYNGAGTPKDEAEAYKWILIASDKRKQQMREAVDFLRANMSAADLAEGEKRAAAWRATKRKQTA